MENKQNVLLSVDNLVVKFHVRGRILTAIRGISLDIYENESIAIVGESGSGKSVFTKTFAGMLDDNGFIDKGNIIFSDPELADTHVALTNTAKFLIKKAEKKLNDYSKYLAGSSIYNEIIKTREEIKSKKYLTDEEASVFDEDLKEKVYQRTELFNQKLTFDPSKEKDKIRDANVRIAEYDEQIKQLQAKKKDATNKKRQAFEADSQLKSEYENKLKSLNEEWQSKIQSEISEEQKVKNTRYAKEIYLSVGRYGLPKRIQLVNALIKAFKKAMMKGLNLDDEDTINAVFDTVVFRVRYLDETQEALHGTCVLNLAKIKYSKDWHQIRGSRIATVFQDPMTSLNPIVTIGKQISSIIIKHQKCSEIEARERALKLMKKVGIPNAENRYDDYPFQYSGGMRQRIVIAIALSCQPKILICDEPTTALDVTIQAQILQLIKDLQKEFGYTIVFITHDLGVVANVADRVAVLYAGQIVEVGTVDEVFYDPRHPYTWALMSSLPQLAQKNTTLFSIPGTPPSLYNAIVGDPFAPRNPYAMKIDKMKEPPMFKITDTHYAKTWLLDERAPKVEKPEVIQNIHEKLIKAFNI